MAVSVIIPPVASPVTLSDIKQHLRIDHDEENDFLLALSQAAVDHVETHIRQSLINRTLRQYCDDLPATNRVVIEGWPVTTVVEVSGYNTAGDIHVIDQSTYRLVRDHVSTELVFDPAINRDMIVNGIEIDFVSGFGDMGLDIPSNILQAIKRIIAHWYEVRGSGQEGGEASLPNGIDRLLAPLRRVSL